MHAIITNLSSTIRETVQDYKKTRISENQVVARYDVIHAVEAPEVP